MEIQLSTWKIWAILQGYEQTLRLVQSSKDYRSFQSGAYSQLRMIFLSKMQSMFWGK